MGGPLSSASVAWMVVASVESTAWCRGSEVERERQGCRERFGEEARSARSRAIFIFSLSGVFQSGVRRNELSLFRLRTYPNPSPARNTPSSSPHSSPSVHQPICLHLPIYPSIHGGEVHITLSRRSLIDVSS